MCIRCLTKVNELLSRDMKSVTKNLVTILSICAVCILLYLLSSMTFAEMSRTALIIQFYQISEDDTVFRQTTPNSTEYQSTTSCVEKFNITLEDNLKTIMKYPKGIADEYLYKIGGNLTSPFTIKSFPVLVTAMDAMYYPASMGMFQSIHSVLMSEHEGRDTVKIVVYDLGMTQRQLNVLSEKCRCEVRSFPFDEFPSHVKNLKSYAFKPIIIQMSLVEFGHIWWLDTSVRFKKAELVPVLDFVEKEGLLFSVNFDPNNALAITKQTSMKTFEYLREDPCKFRSFSETSATSFIMKFTKKVDILVKAWVTCALNKDCIAPDEADKKINCNLTDTSDGRCHRFDQSVLSILIRRLYHTSNNPPKSDLLKSVIEIQRGQITHYFEDCYLILKCLA